MIRIVLTCDNTGTKIDGNQRTAKFTGAAGAAVATAVAGACESEQQHVVILVRYEAQSSDCSIRLTCGNPSTKQKEKDESEQQCMWVILVRNEAKSQLDQGKMR